MLVDFYKKYYEDSSIYNLNELIYCLENYDFENYQDHIKEIFYFYKKIKNINIKNEKLKTNGSTTGVSKSYLFGPNCWNCIEKIESNLRNNKKNKTICISSIFFGASINQMPFVKKENDIMADLVVKGDWSSNFHVDKLIKTIEDYYEINGPINILSHPNILLCISTNKIFRRWASENYKKINSIINIDFDLSIKNFEKIYVRDQMIDWKSGGNFYNCEFGNTHFLPIFYKTKNIIFNLLNLNKKFTFNDDLISVENEKYKCNCGKNYIKLKFVTHYKNKIKDENNNFVSFSSLYPMLEENYYNLQFFQKYKNKNINVIYCSKGKKNKDLEIIKNFLNSKGLYKIKFTKDSYFSIGRKRYSNWKSNLHIETKNFNKFEKEVRYL